SQRPPPPLSSTLSLHDALPISEPESKPEPFDLPPKFDKSAIFKEIAGLVVSGKWTPQIRSALVERFEGAGIKYPEPLISGGLIRSEEHTSEIQSRFDIVCRLLL